MKPWFKFAQRVLLNVESEDQLRDEFATRIPYQIEHEYIPKTSREFYKDFGPIHHQSTNEVIEDLAPYQHDIFDCDALTVFVDKCQKSGVTTWELAHDFQQTLLYGKGKDCLIVGQTQQHAHEHIYTLKRMIADSEKYRKYMITNSRELFFREEQTKMSIIFIKNPDNPFRPSRIIGLPFRQQSLWSWKNVFRVHISDPSIAPIVNDAGVYAAAKGRLANTNGKMLIEGPPNGVGNKFYEYYEQYNDNHDPNFQVFLVLDEDAKKANVISEEFLEQAKKELGPLYAQYYQGSFLIGIGALFTEEMIKKCVTLGWTHRLDKIPINPNALHYGGIDPESLAAVYVVEVDFDEEIVRVIVANQYPREITPSQLANEVFKLHEVIPNCYWFVDGNHRGYVNELKAMFNEDQDWLTRDSFDDDIRVIPVNFSQEHRNMLVHLWNLADAGMLAIDDELAPYVIKAMRTAKHKAFQLDKVQTKYSDDLDALRLACRGVKRA
ncbi:MAG TPA: hypothetical protein VGE97_01195 [Nitrososphaera sp.]|jgi:hypothetical protein